MKELNKFLDTAIILFKISKGTGILRKEDILEYLQNNDISDKEERILIKACEAMLKNQRR